MWQLSPSLAAASASMRPNWPPPRIPMVAPGFSNTRFAHFRGSGNPGPRWPTRKFSALGPRFRGDEREDEETTSSIFRSLRDGFGLPRAPGVEALGDLLIRQGQYAGCKQCGVDCARLADGERPDRHAARHLHDREQRVLAFQRMR